jgi:ribosomal protein L15E
MNDIIIIIITNNNSYNVSQNHQTDWLVVRLMDCHHFHLNMKHQHLSSFEVVEKEREMVRETVSSYDVSSPSWISCSSSSLG